MGRKTRRGTAGGGGWRSGEGWGGGEALEFGEISGREEDEKRGFLGAVGLLLRCVEASDRNSQRQTGRQEDRLRLCAPRCNSEFLD